MPYQYHTDTTLVLFSITCSKPIKAQNGSSAENGVIPELNFEAELNMAYNTLETIVNFMYTG